jgi:hypothetical protein
MLIDVNNKSIELRAWDIDIRLESNHNVNTYPYVIREVTNMFPDGCTTLRKFGCAKSGRDDAASFRYRAMLHAAHFLGFDPFHPPILLGGWANMFPLPDWRELRPYWDAMFPNNME